MPDQRQHSLDAIHQSGDFDVVVVGGGINGIGVFRELALQGLRVLLVERNDFCSGCSAAPSRMIHGGLRYLENGEFNLVRESLAERDTLLQQAPHMVRPLPTTIPIRSVFSGALNAVTSFFGWTGKPSSRGALPIKIGLSLYDWVTRGRRVLPRHAFRGRRATAARWPMLTPQLRFSATYHDAWISHPERLGLEILRDATAAAPNCVALNYTEIRPDAEGFVLKDMLTGTEHRVNARAVVNATGAWLDEALGLLAPKDAPAQPLVSGTKGSHLVLDNPALEQALGGHMIYFENDDGRVCIVFPYLGRVLAGSTDIRVNSASRVRCEPEERDYILGSLRRVFPQVSVGADQILFSYSGIRPLPQSDANYTGRISRSHYVKCIDGAVPQFCMIGGKWTTFRAFAEQTADMVLPALGQTRKVDTSILPIGGGKGFPSDADFLVQQLVTERGITAARAAHLVDIYGTKAQQVLDFCLPRDDDNALVSGCDYTTAEIIRMIRDEHVVHLADVVLRRTPLAITGAVSLALIDVLCALMTAELGWSSDQAKAERTSLIDDLQTYHGVSMQMLETRST